MATIAPTPSSDTPLADASERSFRDPAYFFREILGEDPWDKQLEIVESVRDHKRTIVQSCHAIGKDWTAAHVVLWFLFAQAPCKVITTGPTDRQVKHILWSELKQARRRLPLGRLLTQELQIRDDWFAMGFTARDYEPAAFQGFHADRVLVVVDEAAGISSEIYNAVEGILSAGFARCLEIGNPTDASCEFARRARQTFSHTLAVSAFDTPNFTELGIRREDIDTGVWREKLVDPLPRPYLVGPEWVAAMVERYGWKHPFVIARVLGRFPGAGSDALFEDEWIDQAVSRELVPEGHRILACDPARDGDDETCIGLRVGGRYRTIHREGKSDLMQLASRLRKLCHEYQCEQIRVDGDGLGAGVVDRLREWGEPVVEMRGGHKAMEDEDYANTRAEWHFALRDRFESAQIDIDPFDLELQEQLRQLRSNGFDAKGRLRMETKEQYKKRVGRSPDDSDTLLYAFAPVDLYPKIQVFA